MNENVYFEEEIISKLKSKTYYSNLCIKKGSVVGYILAQKILDFFEIHSLFVSPNFRRKGIAKTLLSNLIENCKNDRINKILLEFVEFNEAAKNLYLKNDFSIYGKRKDYYLIENKRFNGILMKREFK